ncbi:MAG: hypothetical protein KBE22_03180 [Candidatus Accumulibacter sp.]|nr:hypothetical protein [Accumulibacter sp.]
MIEELGGPQELDDVGNFSHGSYSLDVGYKSRAGYSMSYLSTWTAATTHGDTDGFAHLVDLGMPAVTRPADGDTDGYYKWNKAVLFGEQKRYSIMSGFNFGIGGWIYKASGGNVWQLLASRPSASALIIEARKLNNSLTTTTLTQVLSIDISAYAWGDTFFVNFDPKGSGRAAIHVHGATGSFGSPWIEYVFETTVTDGDDPSLPTVTATLTYTASNCSVTQTTDSAAQMQRFTGSYNKTVISVPTLYNGGPNYIGVAEESWDSPIYTTVGVSEVHTVETLRAMAVTYKKDGTRVVIGFRSASERHIPYETEIISITGHLVETYDGTTTLGYPVSQVFPVVVGQSVYWDLDILKITRDGVAASGYERRTDFDTVANTQTVSGTGQQSNGVWIQDDAGTKINLLTPNSCCIYKVASGNASMFAWASAEFGGTLSATAPDLLSGLKFCFDPESGSYNRRVVKWF